jgi:hypothetical protein
MDSDTKETWEAMKKFAHDEPLTEVGRQQKASALIISHSIEV